MDRSESDANLVARARAGEVQAFGQIVERYHGLLHCLARGSLGCTHEAADAVQEAWLLAYLHLNQLQDPARLGPWLRRITANACRQRTRSRRDCLPLEAIREQSADPTRTVDERLVLEQVLAVLSPPTRLTVALFYLHALTVEEIARFQELPFTTIKSRLRNARVRLRKELEATMETKPPMGTAGRSIAPSVLSRIQTAGELHGGALSPDGTLLVTEAALEVTETKFDGRICAWEVATGDLLWATDLTSWSKTILFTPDGGHVALATGPEGRRDGREGRILFLDTITGTPVREIATTPGPLALAFSPDGKQAATGHSEEYSDDRSQGYQGVIRIFDLRTGVQTQMLAPHLNQIHTLAFSPDGKTLASSGLLRNTDPDAVDIWLGAEVCLWNLETGTVQHRLVRPSGRGIRHNLVFSPDGQLLAAPNGREGEVLLWDASNGKLARTLPGSDSPIHVLAFAPDGNWLATGSQDGAVYLFELDSHPVGMALLGHHAAIAMIHFSPDGSRLLTVDRHGSVQSQRL